MTRSETWSFFKRKGDSMRQEKKDNIIQAAIYCFSSYGYKATTMEQIAKQASIGKGTVYNFFSSKEELFQSILKEVTQEMKEIAVEKMGKGEHFFEGIHETILAFLDYQKNHRLVFKIMQEAKEFGTPILKQEIKKIDEYILQFIEKELEKAVERKEVKPCKADITAFVLFKMYLALLVEWEKEHAALSDEQVSTFFQEYIRNGLGL